MLRNFGLHLGSAGQSALLMLAFCMCPQSYAQDTTPADSPETGNEVPPGDIHGQLLKVPMNTIVPGAISVRPQIQNPALEDPGAVQRGMHAFSAFNCVGCHMGNGGGGMGPALSNRFFIYGSKPENIYLSIVQGRPHGMPAWSAVLPDEVIWDLVAYVESISAAPVGPSWGTTSSAATPTIQQIPAELQATATPWKYTEQSTNGQKP